jgi:ketosteroid isomerase-like protein
MTDRQVMERFRHCIMPLLWVFLFYSGAPAGVCAQNASEQSRDAPIIADSLAGTAKIRALEAEMEEGVLNRDVETLRQLWSSDFMVNAPRNVVVPDRGAVLDVFRKGIANYSVFDTQIEEVRLRGNMAVVMGSETVKPVGDAPYAGKTVDRRYTHVWRQQEGRWRLFARHAHIVSVN